MIDKNQSRRPGQPRKEPTKVLAYRVPVRIAEKIDKKIREVIKKEKSQ